MATNVARELHATIDVLQGTNKGSFFNGGTNSTFGSTNTAFYAIGGGCYDNVTVYAPGRALTSNGSGGWAARNVYTLDGLNHGGGQLSFWLKLVRSAYPADIFRLDKMLTGWPSASVILLQQQGASLVFGTLGGPGTNRSFTNLTLNKWYRIGFEWHRLTGSNYTISVRVMPQGGEDVSALIYENNDIGGSITDLLFFLPGSGQSWHLSGIDLKKLGDGETWVEASDILPPALPPFTYAVSPSGSSTNSGMTGTNASDGPWDWATATARASVSFGAIAYGTNAASGSTLRLDGSSGTLYSAGTALGSYADYLTIEGVPATGKPYAYIEPRTAIANASWTSETNHAGVLWQFAGGHSGDAPFQDDRWLACQAYTTSLTNTLDLLAAGAAGTFYSHTNGTIYVKPFGGVDPSVSGTWLRTREGSGVIALSGKSQTIKNLWIGPTVGRVANASPSSESNPVFLSGSANGISTIQNVCVVGGGKHGAGCDVSDGMTLGDTVRFIDCYNKQANPWCGTGGHISFVNYSSVTNGTTLKACELTRCTDAGVAVIGSTVASETSAPTNIISSYYAHGNGTNSLGQYSGTPASVTIANCDFAAPATFGYPSANRIVSVTDSRLWNVESSVQTVATIDGCWIRNRPLFYNGIFKNCVIVQESEYTPNLSQSSIVDKTTTLEYCTIDMRNIKQSGSITSPWAFVESAPTNATALSMTNCAVILPPGFNIIQGLSTNQANQLVLDHCVVQTSSTNGTVAKFSNNSTKTIAQYDANSRYNTSIGLADSTYLPSGSSLVVKAGTPSTLLVDYNDVARSATPTVGAFEYVGKKIDGDNRIQFSITYPF